MIEDKKIKYDAVVSQHFESGDNSKNIFKTIQSAIDSVPGDNSKPYIIYIKNGDYLEHVRVNKPFVTLIGEDKEKVRVFADTKGFYSKEYIQAEAVLLVQAPNFKAENLTIENTFDYMGDRTKSKDDPTKVAATQAQAVKVSDGSDKTFFVNCRLLGYQDTLYARVGRQYYYKCYICGNVDFIYGAGQTVVEDCDIVSMDRGEDLNGFVTAPSTNIKDKYGILILNCRLLKEHPEMKNNSVALGRPWHPTTDMPDGTRQADPNAIGSSVFKNCYMDSHIMIEGWDKMHGRDKDGNTIYFYPEDSRFFEYNSSGPGALKNPKRRNLSKEEAEEFTIEKIFAEWSPS